MDLFKLSVEEGLFEHLNNINNKLLELVKKCNKRYFAFRVLSGTETCIDEGWDYEINHKSFNEDSGISISALERYGYTVIDKEKVCDRIKQ